MGWKVILIWHGPISVFIHFIEMRDEDCAAGVKKNKKKESEIKDWKAAEIIPGLN